MRSKALLLLFSSLAVAACAEREQTEAPAIIDHGDGTYSHTVAEGRDTTTTRREGALTWTYVEQARHAYAPEPMTQMSYVARPAQPDRGTIGMQRVDEDGSVWVVTAVDQAVVDAQLATANASSLERQRGLHLDDPARKPVPAVEPVGRRNTIETQSWTFDGSCQNAYWEGDDDRTQVAVNTDRRKAVVQIGWYSSGNSCPYNGDMAACLQAEDWLWCKQHVEGCNPTPPSTSSKCTGTILRQQWVLTAAHCVFDSNNNRVATSNLRVKRSDGVQAGWLPVTSAFVDGGFVAAWDPNDDWVLLKLTSPLALPFSDMDISGASDTTLANLSEIDNLAFPQFAPGCSSNSSNAMYLSNDGELGSIYSQKINFKLDSGPRHSGSPVLYCPNGNNDGNCDGDEVGFIIGIISGWNPVETTIVGPKGPEQRASSTTIMDNN